MTGEIQNIIAEMAAWLRGQYGDRLVKVVVFGSEARGDAGAESDLDLLVVLKGPVRVADEVHRISPFQADICLRYGRVVDCLFMDEQRFLNRNGPLLRNIRREGVAV